MARDLRRRPEAQDAARRLPEQLALIQGSYYLATGAWSLVDMRSFERVTGPKTDRWLVRTVGVLVSGLGAGLVKAALRGHVPRDLRLVAASSAAGLAAVEIPTATRGRISPVYLLDAAAEVGFAVAGLLPREKRRAPSAPEPHGAGLGKDG